MLVQMSVQALAAAFVVVLFASGVAAARALRRRVKTRRRMARLVQVTDIDASPAMVVEADHLVGQATSVVSALDRRYPLSGGLRTVRIAVSLGIPAAAVVAFALEFVGMPLAVALVFGLALATVVAWRAGDLLEQRQRLRFTDRLLVVVEDFQRMVRFGMSATETFRSVARSSEEPLRASLRLVEARTDVGVPLGVALGEEAKRVRSPELAMLAAIALMQSQSGGRLSEAIDNLASVLRERIDTRARARAATAESKVSLLILTCVPFVAVGIQAALQPQILGVLLSDARYLLGIGGGMIAAGLGVAWHLASSIDR